jgi:hypothetical protein
MNPESAESVLPASSRRISSIAEEPNQSTRSIAFSGLPLTKENSHEYQSQILSRFL